MSLNAYNDYLELLEIAKERQKKGDYDYNNMVENKGIKKKNAYTNFINNFAKLNTYIDEEGKIVKYNNPKFLFSKKIGPNNNIESKK